MPENDLRALLNRVRWDPSAGAGDVNIAVRVRRVGESCVEVVPFVEVSAVLTGGFEVGGGTFIPYHRVLAVRRGSTVLWQVRKGDDDEA